MIVDGYQEEAVTFLARRWLSSGARRLGGGVTRGGLPLAPDFTRRGYSP